jgi:hypothetical protein
VRPLSPDPLPAGDAVTGAPEAVNGREGRGAEYWLPLVYDELRRLACARLAREATGQTLQATALVHEAYLRLVGSDPGKPWDGSGHFFAAAVEAMRCVLVENARRKRRVRGSGMNTGVRSATTTTAAAALQTSALARTWAFS